MFLILKHTYRRDVTMVEEMALSRIFKKIFINLKYDMESFNFITNVDKIFKNGKDIYTRID